MDQTAWLDYRSTVAIGFTPKHGNHGKAFTMGSIHCMNGPRKGTTWMDH